MDEILIILPHLPLIMFGTKALINLIGEIRFIFNVCSKFSSSNSFIEKNKNLSIDILINNADITQPQGMKDLQEENLEQALKIHLISPIKLIKAFVPNMIKG